MPVKKGRQGEADECQRVRDLVEDRIRPHGRIDADRQRDEERQDLRGADDEERRRDALEDQFVDVDAAREGEAPIAVEHRDEPVQIAQP